jgi:NAD-dependent dihydropyrimidine dehydrogenase PreA subunit/nitroreductase
MSNPLIDKIVVDRDRCGACGLCAEICHEQCIALVKEKGRKAAEVDHALCSTCTQCIAICPRQALSWDRVPALPYDRDRLPAAEQLAELLKQRRTIRRFQERPIDRARLAEIVGYGIYAPTNHYALRAIVVDDPAIMEALDRIVMRFARWMYNLFYRYRMVFNLVRAITPAVDAKGKVKLERGLASGRTFDTLPAALILVAGDRRILLAEASAQYALYNMILYAQAQGIGSRINGGMPLVLNQSRAAKGRLGLGKREHILAAVELGYPAVRFRNKVEGKTMGIEWNGGNPPGSPTPLAQGKEQQK